MPVPIRRAALACVLLLSVAACSTSPRAAGPVAIEHETFDSTLHVDLAASTHTASGLYYRDLVVGTGPVATNGMHVAMLYTGWLDNGKQFDAAVAGQQPYQFVLGTQAVIPGWDEGLVGMRVGGTRQLIIPSNLGYGPTGSGPIPPYATLVFNVEMVAAQ